MGSFWDHFGIVLGSFWDRFGIVLYRIDGVRGLPKIEIPMQFESPDPPVTHGDRYDKHWINRLQMFHAGTAVLSTSSATAPFSRLLLFSRERERRVLVV